MDYHMAQFKTRHGLVDVKLGRYGNGRMAVQLVASNDGEPIATLSVNVVEAPAPGPNQFWAKTYSENVEVAEQALASGHFKDLGKRHHLAYDAYAELWEYVP